MALSSPTIPTSFVPRPADPQRFRTDLTGAFGFFAYGVFLIVLVLAFGVFIYGRILAAEQTSKDNALQAAVTSINAATAEGFIRLNNRLTLGQSLLDSHIAFSGFFALLDTIMPSTVNFSALQLSIDNTGVATVQGTGLAKTFNALAATSAAFAADGRIKDAIFSNLKVNKDNSVTFLLSATLDPSLVTFSAGVVATSTSASSTSP